MKIGFRAEHHFCRAHSTEDHTDHDRYKPGWGALSHGGSLPDVLQTMSLKIFSDDYCIKTSLYEEDTFNTGASFCAGYDDGSQDSCQGDSGGPLICVVDGAPVLYGVVSYGYGCADSDYPGIYAKVASQIDWLSSVIDTNECDVGSCLCKTGYRGDGITCENINECEMGTHMCDAFGACQDTDGSHTCKCHTGFTQGSSSLICTDTNECDEGSHICHINGLCVNTVGSYACVCKPDYMGNGLKCSNKKTFLFTLLQTMKNMMQNMMQNMMSRCTSLWQRARAAY